jgi:hypothetical protein
MSKGFIVKSIIILIVVALIYSVFWFFQTGQVQKRINNFIAENSSHISVGEVSISGYPLMQKITIKDLKFTALPKIRRIRFFCVSQGRNRAFTAYRRFRGMRTYSQHKNAICASNKNSKIYCFVSPFITVGIT